MGFDVIMYTRKEFTNKINPYCEMPAVYRSLTANNQEKLRQFNQWGPGAVNFLKTGRVGNAHARYSRRVLAEAIRRNVNRPVMTREILNDIVSRARSFMHGENLARTAKSNNGRLYRINTNGPNYTNFRKKLIAKFPMPISADTLGRFLRNSKSNTEFANKIRSWAIRSGRTVNENQLRGIIATRAKTREGAKRVRNAETERIYLVNGKDWFNGNATNVTNKINANNWVRTNNDNTTKYLVGYANSNNVKTYKRKVANFNSARAARARQG
jgi:hypothetical protein